MIGNFIRRHPKLRQSVRNIKMYFLRMRYGLKNVHKTFYMGGPSKVSKDFVAGAYAFMNYGCDICPKVRAGNYVMFGPQVIITGSDHRYDQAGVPMYFTKRSDVPVTIIEDDVWLGCRSIILAGIKIGKGSVVAAGSVVTKDVAPYSIIGGVPAKLIRNRFNKYSDIVIHNQMLSDQPKDAMYPDPIEWQKH